MISIAKSMRQLKLKYEHKSLPNILLYNYFLMSNRLIESKVRILLDINFYISNIKP